ncbi:hypothetical protein O181_018463 [Austropuccinia psidii MF-1]|uniref:Uncharacterized protein n=1 Tax=Austropuccinia psidii MF-1 TaxID=1389203 RepID=A0A9Q3GSQ8_9BASI|nr:hypothetical protein [Austropuccinia psidii MF-1]
MGGILFSPTIDIGNSRWENDFSQDGLKNISASPTPLHYPYGDCSMDNGLPPLNLHGRECPSSHSKPQKSVAQTTSHQQIELSSSFSRP